MKVLYIALIATTLIACSDNKNNKSLNKATTVGALAQTMIETQTTDDGEPLDINAIKFKSKDKDEAFIEVGFLSPAG
tara:strand:- start:332 stop:562 length:231 start_codon:yes stop_codon:yes gene_type:complete